jgi:maltooligosyltrehalose trehalohydrolase
VEQFAKVWREGYAFTGEYSPFRKARHGQPTDGTSLRQFVVCAQNHDQVGNRMTGDRLSVMVDFESLKLAAGCVILSPFTPLLFMGEEYGEPAPFQYMVDHGDAELLQAVQNGRRKEFASFGWTEGVPDPACESTFARSRLNRSLRYEGKHQKLFHFYRELLRMRKSQPAITNAERSDVDVTSQDGLLLVHYRQRPELFIAFSFAKDPRKFKAVGESEEWKLLLDSAAPEWDGPGGNGASVILPKTFLVLSRERGSAI